MTKKSRMKAEHPLFMSAVKIREAMNSLERALENLEIGPYVAGCSVMVAQQRLIEAMRELLREK